MPKLLPKQYGKILYESTKGLKGADLENVIKKFVQLLRGDQMLSKADYIIKEYEVYAKKQEGIETIEIVSARELTQNQVKEISTHFGEKVEAATRVDEKLIGGVMIKTENTILDGSVRGQLEKLKQQL